MKKGIFILAFLGVVLVAFFYMSPVTPSSATQDNEAEVADETTQEQLSPEEQVDEALRQLNSGELPPMQAVLKIRDVAEKYPGNVKANFTLGEFSMQTGQYDKAVGRFETVVEQQPEYGQAWKLLSEAQLKSGDTTQAQQSFEKAIQLVDKTTAEAFKKEFPELNSIN